MNRNLPPGPIDPSATAATNAATRHIPAPLPPGGPVPSQRPAFEALTHLVRLHRHQVEAVEDDEALVRPPHLWLTGPRGCGKSHLARLAAVASGLPWIRTDLSRYAVAGQPGRNLELLFQELADHADLIPVTETGAGLVLLEGLDRELTPASSERSRALQAEVAALLEGRDLRVRLNGRNTQVNTRRLLFLLPFTDPGAGPRRPLGFAAEPTLPAAVTAGPRLLLDAGIHPGLLDLTGSFLGLPPLGAEDLGSLLLHPDGVFAGTRRLFAEAGLKLEFTHEARAWIASEALRLERGGHGLLPIVADVAPRLVHLLGVLPACVGTLRVNADFLAGRSPTPECIAGLRTPVPAPAPHAIESELPAHPDFPPESLPHRPTRPTNTGASSQGRLANLNDLNTWIQ